MGLGEGRGGGGDRGYGLGWDLEREEGAEEVGVGPRPGDLERKEEVEEIGGTAWGGTWRGKRGRRR